MAITVNIRYKGKEGTARKFATEMMDSGVVQQIREEEGNLKYEYFLSLEDPETILLIDSWKNQKAIDKHHQSEMMSKIMELREKYDLHMEVVRYKDDDSMPSSDASLSENRMMEENKKEFFPKVLTANMLKVIAIIAMTIDHLAWLGYDYYPQDVGHALLHCIGRLTAPIMIYFVAEGYHYTHNFKRYATRMFILAVISHFAYCYFNGSGFNPFNNLIFNWTSVIWPLFCGLILLKVYDLELENWKKYLITVLVCIVTFASDWSFVAPLAILLIGRNRGHFERQMLCLMLMCNIYGVLIFIFADHLYGIVHLACWLAVPLLAMYNGQLGKPKWLGKFFYYYYPVHMVVLGLIYYLFLK